MDGLEIVYTATIRPADIKFMALSVKNTSKLLNNISAIETRSIITIKLAKTKSIIQKTIAAKSFEKTILRFFGKENCSLPLMISLMLDK